MKKKKAWRLEMEFNFESYREYYNLLIDYIPSLGKLNRKPRYIILNIDLIWSEAKKSNFNIKDGSVASTNDYDFEEHLSDDEVIDILFQGFSDVGDILILQNSNVNSHPFECKFSDLKSELAKLPMMVFDMDVVIIWKSKRVVTIFQHTGYYAHIFCN
ncbi:MAG TPA: hypothetical protein VF941_09625 [Clostridia bacterium]